MVLSMGNPLPSMLGKMKDIGLYACTGTTLVEAELKAYAVGLELLCQTLWELERESFVLTASEEGLELRERSCGGLRDFLSLEDRREMLLYRMAVTVNDYTAKGLEQALLAVGIRTAVSGMEDKSVYINVLGTTGERKKSQEEIKAAAAEFLPAHAEWFFDFGVLSWDYIDGKENTFDQMDRADLAWSEIDGYAETAE